MKFRRKGPVELLFPRKSKHPAVQFAKFWEKVHGALALAYGLGDVILAISTKTRHFFAQKRSLIGELWIGKSLHRTTLSPGALEIMREMLKPEIVADESER